MTDHKAPDSADTPPRPRPRGKMWLTFIILVIIGLLGYAGIMYKIIYYGP